MTMRMRWSTIVTASCLCLLRLGDSLQFSLGVCECRLSLLGDADLVHKLHGVTVFECVPIDLLLLLQPCECLGACADAPVMLVNDRNMLSYMSHEKLDTLVELRRRLP